jgi:hypothetical protein
MRSTVGTTLGTLNRLKKPNNGAQWSRVTDSDIGRSPISRSHGRPCLARASSGSAERIAAPKRPETRADGSLTFQCGK